jgi:hypothetical protein
MPSRTALSYWYTSSSNNYGSGEPDAELSHKRRLVLRFLARVEAIHEVCEDPQ